MEVVTKDKRRVDVAISVEIALAAAGDPREIDVVRMFDDHESETFDPTECTEIECAEGLYRLKPGDVICMNVVV